MNRKHTRFSISPRATLAVTVSAALVVLAGGICLARHVEQVHVVGDRRPVRQAGEEIEQEFGQLERLYEKHLRQLAAVTTAMNDPSEIAKACSAIVGVQQWSLIHVTNGFSDIHVPVGILARDALPWPTFQVRPDGPAANDLVLSPDEVFQVGGPGWGWIADPGKPLLFWERIDAHSDRAVVMGIDPQAVHDALDGWLAAWAQRSFTPLEVRNGPLCALNSAGGVLVSTGPAPTAEPDFILPVRSLFGTWDLVAWDRTVRRVSFDARTLAVGTFLALVIFVLGVIAFLQQRRLLADAVQRVTFVNRVSHELRSPLTNILLNVDLSLDMLPDREGAPGRRLALVQEEARRLRRLVDNVLLFSSIEQRKPRSSPGSCGPDEVIAGVMRQFATAFSRRDIEVTYRGTIPRVCRLDADALTQILANLFSNVEKYAPGARVTVETELRQNWLTVLVRDDGPGIPADEAERIFQPFQRVEGHVNEQAGGTGLGLSIARELALGMGGTLRLVPGPIGASFELHVPAPGVEAGRSLPS